VISLPQPFVRDRFFNLVAGGTTLHGKLLSYSRFDGPEFEDIAVFVPPLKNHIDSELQSRIQFNSGETMK
jgi:hypothetical protein